MCRVKLAVYNVHYIVFGVQCSVYNVKRANCSLHFVVLGVYHAVFSMVCCHLIVMFTNWEQGTMCGAN